MANRTLICVTAYTHAYFLHPSYNIVILTVFVPLALVTVISNFILTISLIRTKQLRKTSIYLIITMSASDCLTGCIPAPLAIALYTKYRGLKACPLELTTQFFVTLFKMVSISMIVLLAIDRYLSIDPNLKYFNNRIKRYFSHPKVKIIIAAAIFGSLITASAITAASMTSSFLHFASGLIAVCLILVTIPTFLYTYAYLKIKRYVKDSDIYNGNEYSSTVNRLKFFDKFGKTVFLLLLSLSVFYSPQLIFGVYISINLRCDLSKMSQIQLFIFDLTVVIAYLNSAISALIIIYRNTNVKGYILGKVRSVFQPRLNVITVAGSN